MSALLGVRKSAAYLVTEVFDVSSQRGVEENRFPIPPLPSILTAAALLL